MERAEPRNQGPICVAVKHGDEIGDELIADVVDPLVPANLAGDDPPLLENRQMLRDHRLRLVQALPQLGDARVLSLLNEAEQPQAKRMTENLQLARVAVNNGIITTEFHCYIA